MTRQRRGSDEAMKGKGRKERKRCNFEGNGHEGGKRRGNIEVMAQDEKRNSEAIVRQRRNNGQEGEAMTRR